MNTPETDYNDREFTEHLCSIDLTKFTQLPNSPILIILSHGEEAWDGDSRSKLYNNLTYYLAPADGKKIQFDDLVEACREGTNSLGSLSQALLVASARISLYYTESS